MISVGFVDFLVRVFICILEGGRFDLDGLEIFFINVFLVDLIDLDRFLYLVVIDVKVLIVRIVVN